jgi:hypothetical protein
LIQIFSSTTQKLTKRPFVVDFSATDGTGNFWAISRQLPNGCLGQKVAKRKSAFYQTYSRPNATLSVTPNRPRFDDCVDRGLDLKILNFAGFPGS